jgi:hypothetical protein
VQCAEILDLRMRSKIYFTISLLSSLFILALLLYLTDGNHQAQEDNALKSVSADQKSTPSEKQLRELCNPQIANPFLIQQNCNDSAINAANTELQTAVTNHEDFELSSKFLADTFKGIRAGDPTAMLAYVPYSIACNIASPDNGVESSYCKSGNLSTYNREFEEIATVAARRGDANASLALAQWYFSKLNDMQREASIKSAETKFLLTDPKYVELNSKTKKYLLNVNNESREVASIKAMLSMYDSSP